MNSIRTIEGATLISIGVFCVSAMVNIALHTNGLLSSDEAQVVTPLQTVVVTAHRLSAAEKAQAREQDALSTTLAIEHGNKLGVLHAG